MKRQLFVIFYLLNILEINCQNGGGIIFSSYTSPMIQDFFVPYYDNNLADNLFYSSISFNSNLLSHKYPPKKSEDFNLKVADYLNMPMFNRKIEKEKFKNGLFNQVICEYASLNIGGELYIGDELYKILSTLSKPSIKGNVKSDNRDRRDSSKSIFGEQFININYSSIFKIPRVFYWLVSEVLFWKE